MHDVSNSLDKIINNKKIYSVHLLHFNSDYFTLKLLSRIMRAGKKAVAMRILIKALFALKKMFGFQPFFSFKHVAFSMRQLFKIYTVTLRKTRTIHTPAMLSPHNQISYGIGHVLACADIIQSTNKVGMDVGLATALANCFIYRSNAEVAFEY